MDNFKFTVLMSVYSKEKPEFLRVALDSVYNQTLMPDEVVLVEDGPLTEDLYSVINDFRNNYKNFKNLKLKKNSGLGVALNEGLKCCSYGIVARMDTDDISINTRFEKQIEFLKNNPQVDVVGGHINEYDENMTKIQSRRIVPCGFYNIKKYIKKRNPLNHVTVMFKKEAVEKVGGYKDCLFFEDYYLWARLYKESYIIENINEYLVDVRGGIDMINRRGGLKYVKSILSFQNKLLRLGVINILEFLINVFLRVTMALLPLNFRKEIYEKKLRGE